MSESTRFFPGFSGELDLVANDLVEHFSTQDYEVTQEKSVTGCWHVSLHKGGIFKSIVGMKTALNIEMEPANGGIQVRAGIGIFGQQAIPTAITMLVFWPILITQIWGLVQQNKLDHEAMECIEHSLTMRMGTISGQAAEDVEANAGFCTECGSNLQVGGKFCPGCGAKVGE